MRSHVLSSNPYLSEESRMLCSAATVHQKAVRYPQKLSSELTWSFMFYKVVIYCSSFCKCWALCLLKALFCRILAISCSVLFNCNDFLVTSVFTRIIGGHLYVFFPFRYWNLTLQSVTTGKQPLISRWIGCIYEVISMRQEVMMMNGSKPLPRHSFPCRRVVAMVGVRAI